MRYALDRAPHPSICRVERSELLRRAPRLNVSDHGTMSLGFDNLDQISQFVGSATTPESRFYMRSLYSPVHRQVIALSTLRTNRPTKQFNSNSLSSEVPNPCFVDDTGETMYLRRVFVTSLCIYVITMSYSIGARQALCKFFKSFAQIKPEGHEYCLTVRGNGMTLCP